MFVFLCLTYFTQYVNLWAANGISSVQSLSCIQLFVTPWAAAYQATLSITNSWNLLKHMSIESVITIQTSHLLSSPSPIFNLSQHPSVFSCDLVPRLRLPKFWNFSFSISPSNEYSGLISSRIDWFDLLTVQRTLKSLLQYNSKASILQRSAFFMVQCSHPYITGKNTALALAAILRPRMCAPNLSWSSRDHLSANPSSPRGPISTPTR